jgi:hypothetical protein
LAQPSLSLWRAVPLVHIKRQPIEKVLTSASYLEQVVRHNAINYSDDDRSRAWSFGFYLSNARYRLAEICNEEIASIWSHGRAAIETLGLMERTTKPRGDVYDSQERVRESIIALQAAVTALKHNFRNTAPQSN